MNAKDKKIISANPNKAPYELLQLGLSQEGFAELDKQSTSGIVNKINAQTVELNKLKAATPVPTDKHVAKPTLTTYEPNKTGDLVMVRNKKTGLSTPMSGTTARAYVSKYKDKYEII